MSDPSPKKRHEELTELVARLQAENDCLRRLHEGDLLSYQLLNEAGYLVNVNQAWLDNLGYQRDEVIGKEFTHFLFTDWRDHFQERFIQLKNDGELHDLRLFLLQKEGSAKPVLLHCKVEQKTDTKECFYHCFFENSRERRFFTEEFLQQENSFIDLAVNAKEMIYRMSLPDGLYDYVSPSSMSILGYSPTAFYESPLLFQDILHPHYLNFFIAEWERIRQGKISPSYEYRIIGRDNSVRWIYQRNIIIRDAHGEPCAVEGILTDITDRKEAELSLEELEQRYHQMQKIGKMGSWEYDIGGKLFWLSDGAKTIYGLPADNDEFLAEQLEEKIVEPERVRRALSQLIEDERAYDLEYEITLMTDNPQKRIIRSSAELIRGERDRDKKVVGVVQDITRQRIIEKQKNVLEDQLKQAQKMEAIGSLAGGIAHDFNNILAAVLGLTDLSIRSVQKGSELEEDLRQIYNAGIRAKELVRQILTFARKSDEQLKPVRVDLIAKEVIKFLRSTIPATVQIDSTFSSNELVMANPVKIHQLIMNLCTNAAFAMSDAGTLTIALEDVILKDTDLPKFKNMKAGLYQRLVIQDNGAGIAEENLEFIFEPFYTTKDVHDGTGMGLAVVNTIVKECGGDISVRSELGQGSTFTIFLPVAQAEETARSQHREMPMVGGTEKILVVDDEVPVCRVLYKILEHVGYEVTTLLDSAKALKLVEEQPDYFDTTPFSCPLYGDLQAG